MAGGSESSDGVGEEAPTRHEVLRDLVAALARHYPTEADARRVAADAGLAQDRILFSGRADNTWNNVVAEAELAGGTGRLVEVAAREYETGFQKVLLALRRADAQRHAAGERAPDAGAEAATRPVFAGLWNPAIWYVPAFVAVGVAGLALAVSWGANVQCMSLMRGDVEHVRFGFWAEPSAALWYLIGAPLALFLAARFTSRLDDALQQFAVWRLRLDPPAADRRGALAEVVALDRAWLPARVTAVALAAVVAATQFVPRATEGRSNDWASAWSAEAARGGTAPLRGVPGGPWAVVAMRGPSPSAATRGALVVVRVLVALLDGAVCIVALGVAARVGFLFHLLYGALRRAAPVGGRSVLRLELEFDDTEGRFGLAALDEPFIALAQLALLLAVWNRMGRLFAIPLEAKTLPGGHLEWRTAPMHTATSVIVFLLLASTLALAVSVEWNAAAARVVALGQVERAMRGARGELLRLFRQQRREIVSQRASFWSNPRFRAWFTAALIVYWAGNVLTSTCPDCRVVRSVLTWVSVRYPSALCPAARSP